MEDPPANSNNGMRDVCFPPGYRFSPTDVELVEHYLKKKVMNQPLLLPEIMANVIREANVYKFNPDALLALNKKPDEKKEWYFFTPRDRKYTNGKRPNRVAVDGVWKANGKDKEIKSNTNTVIGTKRTLAFYKGKVKTNWIMHEFKVAGDIGERTSLNDMRLDLVLCRIYEKNGQNKEPAQAEDKEDGMVTESSSVSFETENPKELDEGTHNSMVATKKSRLGNGPQSCTSDQLPVVLDYVQQSMNMSSAMAMNELSNGNLMVGGGNGCHNSISQVSMVETSFWANNVMEARNYDYQNPVFGQEPLPATSLADDPLPPSISYNMAYVQPMMDQPGMYQLEDSLQQWANNFSEENINDWHLFGF